MFDRLSQKFLNFAKSKRATWWLVLLAFSESSFFPIPPDLLLIPMALEKKKSSFRYALICTLSSAVGGLFGYFIGYYFMHQFGYAIIKFYGIEAQFLQVQALFRTYGLWAVGIAGFTPIPYKLFTISSGLFGFSLIPFFIMSFISRGARFFIVSGLLYLLGEKARTFIEKKFGLISTITVVLLVLSYVVLKYIR